MRFGLLLLVFLGVGCQQAELPHTVQKAADMHVPQLYDPYKLPNILGEKDAYVEAKFADSKSEVPKVDLNLDGEKVGYYEIQRCPAGLELLTAWGDNPLTDDYSSQDLKERDYLYVWGKAAAGACTLLGDVHIADPFVDDFNTEEIGGTDGFSFFYLVRPCLQANKSIYGARRRCSYAFARTKTIENYVNNVALEKQSLKAELAEHGSRLEFLMMQMAGNIREKAAYLHKCETNWLNSQMIKKRLVGIAKVALTAGAIVTAAALSGGSAAFLAGTAAVQLSDKLFSSVSNAKVSDNCPTDDYDDRDKGIVAAVKKTMGKIKEARIGLGELDKEVLANPPATPPAVPGLEEKIAAATDSP